MLIFINDLDMAQITNSLMWGRITINIKVVGRMSRSMADETESKMQSVKKFQEEE